MSLLQVYSFHTIAFIAEKILGAMRFINSETRKLHWFEPTDDIPVYAILSHVWGSDEVSYQDMLDTGTPKEKQGFTKIKAVCEKAAHDGLKYVWVDTCCINKESSAELSDAINRMYEWYHNAEVCYVYLADVPSTENPHAIHSYFSRSKWFSRGWTLQELIAPSSVIFYGADWKEVGTKASLQPVISTVTGIDSAVILSNHTVDICAAQIMSWAAKRQTTKEEDIAYCLMGLFDVNMPINYGEGRAAFLRLQQEIIKTSTDQTIFAWKSIAGEERGPLAQSPAEFFDSNNVVRKDHDEGQSYSLTNKGLLVDLPISRVQGKKDVFLASLGCTIKNDDDRNIAIYLRREKGKQYVRTSASTFTQFRLGNTKPTSLFIKERDSRRLGVDQRMPPPSQYTFIVRPFTPEESRFMISKVHPPEFWTQVGVEGLLTMKNSGTSLIIMFRPVAAHSEDAFAVLLGVHNYSVWSDVVTGFGDETAEAIRDSYYNGNRSSKLWENRDRSSAEIPDGRVVLLSIRKAMISGKRQFLAEMSIKNPTNSEPGHASQLDQWTRPQVKYMFWVTIPTTIEAHGFVVKEALPISGDPYWVENSGLQFLCLDHSGSSGILMFENPESKEKFAVMVGVHNHRIWTDVVTNFGGESASDIRDSYYGDHGRNDTLWLQRNTSTGSLQDGKIVRVAVRSGNNADFMTDITVEPHGLAIE